MSDEILYEDEIPGGAHWSMLMRAGTCLRLIDKLGVGVRAHEVTGLYKKRPDGVRLRRQNRTPQGGWMG